MSEKENFCEEWLIHCSFNTVNLEECAQAYEFFEQIILLRSLQQLLQWKLSLQGTNEWDTINWIGPHLG